MQNFNDNINQYEEALKKHIKEKKKIDELYINKKNNDMTNHNKNSQYENILKMAKEQIRYFNYPPSLQKKSKRDISIKKYTNSESYGDFPLHCGVHYSTSAYAYFYLMRQQPFSDLLVKLQGFSLENPNRCFISFSTLEYIIFKGNDNRESIPEFFSKIEYFLNLNCSYFGLIQGYDFNVDDVLIDIFPGYQKKIKFPLSIYAHFILQHKKLLNSKFIGYYINNWIDNIFGINQFPPEKLRKNSCNIYYKYSYEQKVNLENKLTKKISKGTLNEKEIKEKINVVINSILSFGQTPYQIFHIAHPKVKILKNEINNSGKNISKKNKIIDEDEEDDDFEALINISIKDQNLETQFKGIPYYFEINPSLNKIFIYNTEGNIIILDCNLFNKEDSSFYQFSNIYTIQKSNIFLYGLLDEKSQYLIYKLKYAFSSFDYNDNINENESFHTNYSDIIKEIKHNKNILDKPKKNNKENSKNEIIKIITCRHIDFSYKIHLIIQKIKKEPIYKVFSFI